jgi:hypothetical protein
MKTNDFCQTLKQAIADNLVSETDPLPLRALEDARAFLDYLEARFPFGTLATIPEPDLDFLVTVLESLRCLGISIEGFNEPIADNAIVRVRTLIFLGPGGTP